MDRRKRKTPDEILSEILARDARYTRDAYGFVSEALGYTVEQADRPGHVTGVELCRGLRDYAVEQFGPLARTVLASWGVRATEDIGEIVFNMVEGGLLRKTDEDRREDFCGVFDFDKAFAGYELHVAPPADGGDADQGEPDDEPDLGA